VTEHVRSLFKYIAVSRGFRLEVAIEPVDDSVGSIWYPYTLPTGHEAVRWLRGAHAQRPERGHRHLPAAPPPRHPIPPVVVDELRAVAARLGESMFAPLP
jgi:hypothetical protein